MQSLWALTAVFLYAVKLKRAIFTLKLYFLESLFLGLVRHGIWKWKWLSPCISLCLQAEKSQVYKWENWHKLHRANTLIPFPLWKTFPNTVGWLFYFSESTGVVHVAHHVCHTSLSSPKMLINNYPAPLLLIPPNQFSLQHLCTCCQSYPLKMGVMGACWIVLCERKLCMPHFQRGGTPSEEGRGGFCESQQGNPVWKASHSCWLLISCPQSTNNARHMMYGFYPLKKKGNKPPLNCKLGIFFRHSSCNKFSSVLFMRNQWLL